MGRSIVINLFEKHQAILLLDFMLRPYLALQEAASLSSKVTCHSAVPPAISEGFCCSSSLSEHGSTTEDSTTVAGCTIISVF